MVTSFTRPALPVSLSARHTGKRVHRCHVNPCERLLGIQQTQHFLVRLLFVLASFDNSNNLAALAKTRKRFAETLPSSSDGLPFRPYRLLPRPRNSAVGTCPEFLRPSGHSASVRRKQWLSGWNQEHPSKRRSRVFRPLRRGQSAASSPRDFQALRIRPFTSLLRRYASASASPLPSSFTGRKTNSMPK